MAVLKEFLHSDPDPAVVFLKKVALGLLIVGAALAAYSVSLI